MMWLALGCMFIALSLAHNTDTCFKQANPCKVDDSQNPPYNTFTNQLDVNHCKRACLDQNNQGVLVNDGGSRITKYCQLAVSRPGTCKLYYQTDIDTAAASGSGSSGSNPVVFGPVRSNSGSSGYSGGSNTGDFGPVRSVYLANQGGNRAGWGPSRTQDGNAAGQGGQGGDQCWKLQPGCPGYGGVGPGGAETSSTTAPATTTGGTVATTTTPSQYAKCFPIKKPGYIAQGAPLSYYGAADNVAKTPGTKLFKETLDDCWSLCLNEVSCVAVNYQKQQYDDTGSPTEKASCILSNLTCIESGLKMNCERKLDSVTNKPYPTDYYERKIPCTV